MLQTFLVTVAIGMAITAWFVPEMVAPLYAMAGVIVAAGAGGLALYRQWTAQ